MTVYGELAQFAIIAQIEAIYVPMAYTMLAVNGEAPQEQEPAEEAEKLEKPEDEEPEETEPTYSLELWVIEAEWSGGELEIEATALLSEGAKLDFNRGTLTLSGGEVLTGGAKKTTKE
jgi:hypothetical protein